MSRKRRGFQWTRADQDERAAPIAERRDAPAERAQKRVLVDLAQRLVAMPPGRLKKLPLAPEALEAIALLARQGPKSSRRRQLLRVQGLLRDTDLESLEVAMAGYTAETERSHAVERWHEALLAGGDEALQDFMDSYTRADRSQLRGLLRRARGVGPDAARASKRLLTRLRALALTEE